MSNDSEIFNLFHRVYKELILNIKSMAEPYEFNRGELPILARLIKGGDGVTQKKLLEDLPISKSTMSKVITNLVDKGYIRKEKDPEDKRATKIFLTEEAGRAEEKIREIDGEVERKMLQGLDDGERKELREYLKKLFENLEMD